MVVYVGLSGANALTASAIAFIRTAAANRVCFFFERDLRDALCDDGTRKRRAEHVFFVLRPRLYDGNDVIFPKFIGEIPNV